MRTIQGKASLVIKQVVERGTTAGQVTRHEHLQLTSILLSAHRISHEERRQINRILDYVQTGRLKLID